MTSTYRPGMVHHATGQKISKLIADADAIAKNMNLDKIEITERLTEMGFSQIAFRRDCVVASINGNTFRLGA